MSASSYPQSDDPFSLVYYALWELLEGSADFAGQVKVGNRISWVKNRDPDKEMMLSADAPAVRIDPGPWSVHYERTSCSTSVERDYRVQQWSGTKRIDDAYLPLDWAIAKALSSARTELADLTWLGETFVTDVSLSGADAGLTIDDLAQEHPAWATVATVHVVMVFATTDMQAQR